MGDDFHDVLFPVDIALGSRGGPVRRTEIVQLASGHERRVARWAHSRRRYEAGYGVRSRTDIEAVIAFFEAREGRRYAFRFRDPLDHTSRSDGGAPTPTDQVLGPGDGTQAAFQLVKSYASGGVSRARPIHLPVEGSVVVAVDGANVPGATVNYLTGIVTFPVPPAVGANVTAGYRFDVPVRFDSDALTVELHPGGGDVPDIPLIEVRAP